MKRRDIIVVLLLSLVTCGLYSLYWMIVTQDSLNNFEGGNSGEPSGVMVIVLTIVTCGIYGLYWYYKIGDRIGKHSNNSSLGVLSLVLGLFSGGFIATLILQSEINKFATIN